MTQTTIDLTHDKMGFSSGHFTIFSATRRERMHGHNFGVRLEITGLVDGNGLLSDYSAYRRIMVGICDELHEYFLLPEKSPHLTLRDDGDRIEAVFDGRAIPFLKEDVKLLPLRNISLEELSSYLCERFREAGRIAEDSSVTSIVVRVYSKPHQCASAEWRRA